MSGLWRIISSTSVRRHARAMAGMTARRSASVSMILALAGRSAPAPSLRCRVNRGCASRFASQLLRPKVAARAREGYRAGPVKSDALDAFSLADLLRRQVDVWRPLRLPSETLSELQALVRYRERFVVEHRRTQHQLRAVLGTYYPGLTHLFELTRSLDHAGLPAPLSQPSGGGSPHRGPARPLPAS